MAPLHSDMDIPSIAFGFTIAFFVLTGTKIFRQSLAIYKRTHSIMSLYIWMSATELWVNLILSILTWLFLRGDIPPSIGVFFTMIFLWTLETQCLLQIIANRVGLVMVDKRKALQLKIFLLVAVGLVNISVFCIWIPAQLRVSDKIVHINEIWDRIEKVIYLVLDLGLNLYFLYLVRQKLIARGLNKYKRLFNFNAAIVCVSISMDALIIGMMSLSNPFVYTQFHGVAYIVKLNIELSMADLISKVVRKQDRTDNPKGSSSNPTSRGTELTSRDPKRIPGVNSTVTQSVIANKSVMSSYAKRDEQKRGDVLDDTSSEEVMVDIPITGIMKTVATTMHEERERRESSSSSTAQLNEYPTKPAGNY